MRENTKIKEEVIKEFSTIEMGMTDGSAICFFKSGFIKDKDGNIKEIPIYQLPDGLKNIIKKLMINDELW